MLEGYLTPLLMSYIDRYIENLDPADLRLSFWGGDVVLRNLQLRADALEAQGGAHTRLPLRVESARVQELRLHIPWTSLGSDPIEVTLTRLECAVTTRSPEEGTKGTRPTAAASPTPSTPTPTPPGTPPATEAPGYAQGMLLQIKNNISVTIEDLIFKLTEDDVVVSVNVGRVAVHSTDDAWAAAFSRVAAPNFLLHKTISLSDITVCLDREGLSGKIEVLEEPLLYRAALECRMRFSFTDQYALLPALTQAHVLCDALDLSLSDLQLSYALGLVRSLSRLARAAKAERGGAGSSSAAAASSRRQPSLSESDLLAEISIVPANSAASGTDSSAPAQPSGLGADQSWSSWAWGKVMGDSSDAAARDAQADAAAAKAALPGAVLSLGVYVRSANLGLSRSRGSPASPGSGGTHPTLPPRGGTGPLFSLGLKSSFLDALSSDATGLVVSAGVQRVALAPRSADLETQTSRIASAATNHGEDCTPPLVLELGMPASAVSPSFLEGSLFYTQVRQDEAPQTATEPSAPAMAATLNFPVAPPAPKSEGEAGPGRAGRGSGKVDLATLHISLEPECLAWAQAFLRPATSLPATAPLPPPLRTRETDNMSGTPSHPPSVGMDLHISSAGVKVSVHASPQHQACSTSLRLSVSRLDCRLAVTNAAHAIRLVRQQRAYTHGRLELTPDLNRSVYHTMGLQVVGLHLAIRGCTPAQQHPAGAGDGTGEQALLFPMDLSVFVRQSTLPAAWHRGVAQSHGTLELPVATATCSLGAFDALLALLASWRATTATGTPAPPPAPPDPPDPPNVAAQVEWCLREVCLEYCGTADARALAGGVAGMAVAVEHGDATDHTPHLVLSGPVGTSSVHGDVVAAAPPSRGPGLLSFTAQVATATAEPDAPPAVGTCPSVLLLELQGVAVLWTPGVVRALSAFHSRAAPALASIRLGPPSHSAGVTPAPPRRAHVDVTHLGQAIVQVAVQPVVLAMPAGEVSTALGRRAAGGAPPVTEQFTASAEAMQGVLGLVAGRPLPATLVVCLPELAVMPSPAGPRVELGSQLPILTPPLAHPARSTLPWSLAAKHAAVFATQRLVLDQGGDAASRELILGCESADAVLVGSLAPEDAGDGGDVPQGSLCTHIALAPLEVRLTPSTLRLCKSVLPPLPPTPAAATGAHQFPAPAAPLRPLDASAAPNNRTSSSLWVQCTLPRLSLCLETDHSPRPAHDAGTRLAGPPARRLYLVLTDLSVAVDALDTTTRATLKVCAADLAESALNPETYAWEPSFQDGKLFAQSSSTPSTTAAGAPPKAVLTAEVVSTRGPPPEVRLGVGPCDCVLWVPALRVLGGFVQRPRASVDEAAASVPLEATLHGGGKGRELPRLTVDMGRLRVFVPSAGTAGGPAGRAAPETLLLQFDRFAASPTALGDDAGVDPFASMFRGTDSAAGSSHASMSLNDLPPDLELHARLVGLAVWSGTWDAFHGTAPDRPATPAPPGEPPVLASDNPAYRWNVASPTRSARPEPNRGGGERLLGSPDHGAGERDGNPAVPLPLLQALDVAMSVKPDAMAGASHAVDFATSGAVTILLSDRQLQFLLELARPGRPDGAAGPSPGLDHRLLFVPRPSLRAPSFLSEFLLAVPRLSLTVYEELPTAAASSTPSASPLLQFALAQLVMSAERQPDGPSRRSASCSDLGLWSAPADTAHVPCTAMALSEAALYSDRVVGLGGDQGRDADAAPTALSIRLQPAATPGAARSIDVKLGRSLSVLPSAAFLCRLVRVLVAPTLGRLASAPRVRGPRTAGKPSAMPCLRVFTGPVALGVRGSSGAAVVARLLKIAAQQTASSCAVQGQPGLHACLHALTVGVEGTPPGSDGLQRRADGWLLKPTWLSVSVEHRQAAPTAGATLPPELAIDLKTGLLHAVVGPSTCASAATVLRELSPLSSLPRRSAGQTQDGHGPASRPPVAPAVWCCETEDDLRTGQFAMGTRAEADRLPRAGQMLLSQHTAAGGAPTPSVMTWRYPHARAVHRFAVTPIPLDAALPRADRAQELRLPCQLQAWDPVADAFVTVREFHVGQHKASTVVLGEDLHSDLWQVRVDPLPVTIGHHVVQLGLSPMTLASCLKIDSRVDLRFLPALTVAATVAAVAVDIQAHGEARRGAAGKRAVGGAFTALTLTAGPVAAGARRWRKGWQGSVAVEHAAARYLHHDDLTMRPLLDPLDAAFRLCRGRSPGDHLDAVVDIDHLGVHGGQALCRLLAVLRHAWEAASRQPPFSARDVPPPAMAAAHYQLSNRTQLRLALTEAGTTDVLGLDAFSQCDFAWQTSGSSSRQAGQASDQRALRLSLNGGEDWSPPFQPSAVGEHRVQLRREDGREAVTVVLRRTDALAHRVEVLGCLQLRNELDTTVAVRSQAPPSAGGPQVAWATELGPGEEAGIVVAGSVAPETALMSAQLAAVETTESGDGSEPGWVAMPLNDTSAKEGTAAAAAVVVELPCAGRSPVRCLACVSDAGLSLRPLCRMRNWTSIDLQVCLGRPSGAGACSSALPAGLDRAVTVDGFQAVAWQHLTLALDGAITGGRSHSTPAIPLSLQMLHGGTGEDREVLRRQVRLLDMELEVVVLREQPDCPGLLVLVAPRLEIHNATALGLRLRSGEWTCDVQPCGRALTGGPGGAAPALAFDEIAMVGPPGALCAPQPLLFDDVAVGTGAARVEVTFENAARDATLSVVCSATVLPSGGVRLVVSPKHVVENHLAMPISVASTHPMLQTAARLGSAGSGTDCQPLCVWLDGGGAVRLHAGAEPPGTAAAASMSRAVRLQSDRRQLRVLLQPGGEWVPVVVASRVVQGVCHTVVVPDPKPHVVVHNRCRVALAIGIEALRFTVAPDDVGYVEGDDAAPDTLLGAQERPLLLWQPLDGATPDPAVHPLQLDLTTPGTQTCEVSGRSLFARVVFNLGQRLVAIHDSAPNPLGSQHLAPWPTRNLPPRATYGFHLASLSLTLRDDTDRPGQHGVLRLYADGMDGTLRLENEADPRYAQCRSGRLSARLAVLQVDNETDGLGHEFQVVALSPSRRGPASAALEGDCLTVEALLNFDPAAPTRRFSVRSARLAAAPAALYLEEPFLTLVGRVAQTMVQVAVGPSSVRGREGGLGDLAQPRPLPAGLVASLCRPALCIQRLELAEFCVAVSARATVRVFVSVDDAGIRISQTVVADVVCSPPPTLLEALAAKVLAEAMMQAGWLLGSLDILGNPAQLARSISHGLQDLVFLPYQSLSGGPGSFLWGIGTGASSLVRHLTVGTLSSVAGLARGIGRNLDQLSGDGPARAGRREPGLSSGFHGLGVSLVRGVVGIAQEPIESIVAAEEVSARGVLTGIGKGLLGVFTRPASGAAGLIHDTSQAVLASSGLSLRPRRRTDGAGAGTRAEGDGVVVVHAQLRYRRLLRRKGEASITAVLPAELQLDDAGDGVGDVSRPSLSPSQSVAVVLLLTDGGLTVVNAARGRVQQTFPLAAISRLHILPLARGGGAVLTLVPGSPIATPQRSQHARASSYPEAAIASMLRLREDGAGTEARSAEAPDGHRFLVGSLPRALAFRFEFQARLRPPHSHPW